MTIFYSINFTTCKTHNQRTLISPKSLGVISKGDFGNPFV